MGDITEYIEELNPAWTDEYVLKSPVTHAARITGVKQMIYKATGIPTYRQKILRVSVSMKRTNLAWVSFDNPRIVNDIFRLSVQNGNSRDFNAFPNVPGKAMKRHDAIVAIMKRLQEQN